jgi:hypothetical protein
LIEQLGCSFGLECSFAAGVPSHAMPPKSDFYFFKIIYLTNSGTPPNNQVFSKPWV